MDIKDKFALYEKTVKRLESAGVSNPIAQIIYLAAEVEECHNEIRELRKEILRLTIKPAMEE